MYSIIDIETTGLNAKTDRITEISIYIHDGEKIVDHFTSLVNPECRIPHNITILTGINNKMVAGAPKFYEIAKKIVEITQDSVFVAHNAGFDYNFIRSEFRRLFYDYRRKVLCTRKLSMKLIPGMASYGLGNLCKVLEIKNHSRHRADGDAMATVKLFEHLRLLDRDLEHLEVKSVRSAIPLEELNNLPESPGVYYLHDETGKIIYIGKSVNIRQRVLSHLNNNITRRAIEMRDQVRHVTCEVTGSDLIAQLLESNEIKKHKPVFNRSLRRTDFNYGLFSHTLEDGYIHLKIERIKGDKLPLTAYSSAGEGRNHLNYLVTKHDLCLTLCGLYESNSGCFHFHLGACKGACVGAEAPEDYNNRVIDAISRYTGINKNFFILDDGRNGNELSVVKVENGRFIGFGYVDVDYLDQNSEVLHEVINNYEDNKDVQVIIKGYLRKNNFEKVKLY